MYTGQWVDELFCYHIDCIVINLLDKDWVLCIVKSKAVFFIKDYFLNFSPN